MIERCLGDGMLCVPRPSNAARDQWAGSSEGAERLRRRWLAREPEDDDSTARAEPRELASFIGHLVFCSDVVPNGRVYMQAMLRQFAGLG